MVFNIVLLVTLCAASYIQDAVSLPLNTSKTSDGRIVGGVETSILLFPHQASLQLKGTHICGAVLIGPQLLLTAAHCVEGFSVDDLAVRIGSSEPYRNGVLIPVQRTIPHEEYNLPTVLNNDIALVVLSHSVTFNRYMSPISFINSTSELKPNTIFFVSGWGATSASEQTVAPILRYTAVVEIDHNTCSSAYKHITLVTPTMICAGLRTGGRDSCQGDSGGPLVTLVRGSLKLLGIVSWGVGCAHPYFPGVYTRVDMYEEWLTNKTSELEAKGIKLS